MSGTAKLGWFANAKKKYLSIFEAADQDRVRGDLRTFFGPRAEKYLAIYEKLRSNPKHNAFTWNWVVFFTTFPWFFYRKMYAIGAAVILVPVTASLLFGSAGSAGSLAVLAVFANTFYVQLAMGRLQKADALGLAGAERDEYLRRAGGVSVIAGTISGVLFAALMIFMIFDVYAELNGINLN